LVQQKILPGSFANFAKPGKAKGGDFLQTPKASEAKTLPTAEGGSYLCRIAGLIDEGD
jgi:hypothetical protein